MSAYIYVCGHFEAFQECIEYEVLFANNVCTIWLIIFKKIIVIIQWIFFIIATIDLNGSTVYN